MDKNDADEILACLPQERTCYFYYKDYYALQLLSYAAGSGMDISALRATPFAALLHKPLVQQVISRFGDGCISYDRINAMWNEWE